MPSAEIIKSLLTATAPRPW